MYQIERPQNSWSRKIYNIIGTNGKIHDYSENFSKFVSQLSIDQAGNKSKSSTYLTWATI